VVIFNGRDQCLELAPEWFDEEWWKGRHDSPGQTFSWSKTCLTGVVPAFVLNDVGCPLNDSDVRIVGAVVDTFWRIF
jgi:hypothetical protein